MPGPIDAVRRSGMPEMPPVEVPEVPAAPAEPAPEAVQIAANKAARRQFFESLGAMEGLSPRFLDYVQERLGLAGRTEVAELPLEEREIQAIRAEAERISAANAVQVSEVVSDAVAREIEQAFRDGEKASIEDVLAELEAVLPGEQLPMAAKMAFEVFREEMKAHVKEMRGLMMAEAMRGGHGRECGAAFAQYTAGILDMVRTMAVNPSLDCLQTFQAHVRVIKSLTFLCTALIKMVEIVVRLRADVARYRTACMLAKAKAEAAIANLEIRELIAEIKKAFLELDEKLQKFKKEIQEDSALAVTLRAAAQQRLEREISEWRRVVAGFETREDRLREEKRDEMEEIALAREGVV